jgi:predicted ribosome quality control (RQC) complex YloA/Tae2 family protein
MFNSLYLSRPWFVCFEGDDDAAAAAKAAADKAAADKAAADKAAADAAAKTFTQEDLNRILAEDRRKHQTQLKEQEARLAEVLKSASLTEQDRKALQENLVSVQGQLRSVEAQAAKEKQELEQSYQARMVEIEKKATTWESMYRDSTVQRSLQDAAVKNDAFSPSQIVTLLKPMTKLVEQLDPITKRPTGQYEVQVEMMDVNPKTNELEKMVRSPEEAVKRMKELPDQYGNLFKSGVVSGIGSGSATGGFTPGSGGKIDVRKLTPAQYREIRAKNPELLGLAPKRR